MLPSTGAWRNRPTAAGYYWLGNFRGTTNDDLNPDTRVPEHGNQGIDGECGDLASEEIADSRLGDVKKVCRLRLGKATRLDQLAEPDHQVGPDLEMLRFFRRESEIAKDIAA